MQERKPYILVLLLAGRLGCLKGRPPPPPSNSARGEGLWLLPDSYDIMFLHIFSLIVQVSNIWEFFLYKNNKKIRQKNQRISNIPLIRKLILPESKAFQAYYVIIYLYILYICVYVCTYIHARIIELLWATYMK